MSLTVSDAGSRTSAPYVEARVHDHTNAAHTEPIAGVMTLEDNDTIATSSALGLRR